MTAATTADIRLLLHGHWLAEQADWLAANSRATELGRRARRAYLDRTQVRNLQRVAETATAVSTLLDYVKIQVGKQPLWRRESFGPMLLDDLERLQARAGKDSDSPGKIHLELCRLFVRQLTAAYVYSIAVDATAPRPAAPAPRPAAPARETSRPPRQRGQRAGESRVPRSTDTASPALGELPAGSDEPEVQAVQALAEGAEATADYSEPEGTQERAEYEAEVPDNEALPAQDPIEREEEAPVLTAPPVVDVAGARESGQGAPVDQEEVK